jgi:hypothetical protein
VSTINVVSGKADKRYAEARIVYWLKAGLQDQGLGGRRARDILVDADGSYCASPYAHKLKPTGTIWISGRRPDLVCIVEDHGTEAIAGFEVKAEIDHEKGLVQASRYRDGVHEAYLCVPGTTEQAQEWLSPLARDLGIGLIMVWERGLDVQIEPAHLRPHPAEVLATRRNLLGEMTLPAFNLNQPLHYIAVLVAFAVHAQPREALEREWGMNASLYRYAVRGARALGLVHGERPTLRGCAYADILCAVGFDLHTDRQLTGRHRRTVRDAPHLAAVLRRILLDHPAVDLIVQSLLRLGGPVTVEKLAVQAHMIDTGMARALFGPLPAVPASRWDIPTHTPFQLKAMMYDTGLIDSPLAPGAGQGRKGGAYNPGNDLWQLGRAVIAGGRTSPSQAPWAGKPSSGP